VIAWDPIALAIPFFLLLIAVEFAVANKRGCLSSFQLGDSLTNIGCGALQRLTVLLVGGVRVAAYIWVWQKARLFDLDPSAVSTWVLAFFAEELSYYFWHRASHRINALWGAHVVHHQSETFNLTVALRQGILTPFTITPFSLVQALVGIPPFVHAVNAGVSTLYQFWIHTQQIDRLGILEAFLNTPSHHRVHHGRDAHYLDRNYGAILIVWDRLFGTFARETTPPTYGITVAYQRRNPFVAQIETFRHLVQATRQQTHWREKLRVWWAPPEQLCVGLPAAKRLGPRLHAVTAMVLITLLSLGVGVLILFAPLLPVVTTWLYAVTLAVALAAITARFDQASS